MKNKAGVGEMPEQKESAAVAANAQAQVPAEIPAQAPNEGETAEMPGKKPEFNVVQPEIAQDGKTIFKNVGALWKNTSKTGREFYTLKIGKLRLLVFANEPRSASIFSLAPEEKQ
jgi:uncharacterized protein (DUF736 family)